MHHFVAETSQIEIGSVTVFLRKAEAIYDENLSAYVKIVLRRPFGKLIVRWLYPSQLVRDSNIVTGLFGGDRTPLEDNCAVGGFDQRQLQQVGPEKSRQRVQCEGHSQTRRRSF